MARHHRHPSHPRSRVLPHRSGHHRSGDRPRCSGSQDPVGGGSRCREWRLSPNRSTVTFGLLWIPLGSQYAATVEWWTLWASMMPAALKTSDILDRPVAVSDAGLINKLASLRHEVERLSSRLNEFLGQASKPTVAKRALAKKAPGAKRAPAAKKALAKKAPGVKKAATTKSTAHTTPARSHLAA